MAKGKKTDNETIYKIMISMFSTNNFNETARQLKLPVSTVEKIFKDNKDKEEFEKLWIEKRDEFVDKASKIIDLGAELLERRLQMALDNQDELDIIIDEIWSMENSKDINETKKKTIINKIGKMQLNNLSEITTAIGTLYDKRALAKGESTENTDITIKMDKKIEELSK